MLKIYRFFAPIRSGGASASVFYASTTHHRSRKRRASAHTILIVVQELPVGEKHTVPMLGAWPPRDADAGAIAIGAPAK
jgi:hypothetical protein